MNDQPLDLEDMLAEVDARLVALEPAVREWLFLRQLRTAVRKLARGETLVIDEAVRAPSPPKPVRGREQLLAIVQRHPGLSTRQVAELSDRSLAQMYAVVRDALRDGVIVKRRRALFLAPPRE